jgi:protein SCO1/2
MKIKYSILYLCIFLVSCQEKVRKLPYYNTADFTPVWEIPNANTFHKIRPFSLIDQKGNTFSEKNMENKICVVDFFFTSCPGICPKMTNSMLKIQKEFLNDDTILLVSHSVTPEKDSVSVLDDYSQKKKIHYNKWKLLTGSKNEIYNLGRKFYYVEEDLGVERDTSIFLHTENFVLIDKQRIIRGIYNSLDPTSMASLLEDIKELKRE